MGRVAALLGAVGYLPVERMTMCSGQTSTKFIVEGPKGPLSTPAGPQGLPAIFPAGNRDRFDAAQRLRIQSNLVVKGRVSKRALDLIATALVDQYFQDCAFDVTLENSSHEKARTGQATMPKRTAQDDNHRPRAAGGTDGVEEAGQGRRATIYPLATEAEAG